jgi:uncharacterized membrane protein
VRVGMLEVTRLMSALVVGVMVAACKHNDDGTQPTTQTYTLALANGTVTAAPGGTATQIVNITRTGGFAGAVALTASGLPTGVTAAFDPQSATGNSSTLTLTAASNAAPGNATITVKGTATGQTEKTATFQLTVNAGTAGGFTVAANPATLTVQQGAPVTSTVTITRTGGFAGAVTLTATGLPNGVTAAFDPAAPTTNSSTLTLTASATAATGVATVTIHGNATGLTEQTTALALTVNAASAGGFTLEMNPAALTVIQGLSATSTVSITRTGGFAGSVNLTATGLPTGVTAAFNPTDVTGATSTLTLTASATAAIGAATVTIEGTSQGQTDQTTTLALTVNIPGSFSLTVDPKTLTIQPGMNGTATVTITRTGGFAGAVTLSATGLPNGVTATFDPAAPTTDQSTLTLTASATAAVGSASVVIHGNGTGLGEHTTTITLTVSTASGSSGNARSSTRGFSTGSSP